MDLKKKEPTRTYEENRNNVLLLIAFSLITSIVILTITAVVIMTSDKQNQTDVSKKSTMNESVFEPISLEKVAAGHYVRLVYDKDTKVIYSVANDGKLTPLIDADGRPKLYNAEE